MLVKFKDNIAASKLSAKSSAEIAKVSNIQPSTFVNDGAKTSNEKSGLGNDNAGIEARLSSQVLQSDNIDHSMPLNEVPESKKTVVAEKKLSKTEKSGSLSSLFSRLKKIKNIEIYAAVALIVIMIGIYITTLGGSGINSSGSGSTRTNEDVYANELETKLVSTLSQIKGAGNVSAMVTVVGSATIEVAYNVDEKTITQSSGGSTTTTTTIVKTAVVVNGNALVILEIKPKLKGVVIVASGAGDVGVRLQLLRAVRALIADDSVNIEILTGK